jgi:hypothetical protein
MKTVIILQNGKKLNESQFINYFERKVLYTIRKYKLLEGIKNNYRFNLKIQDFFVLKKIDNVFVSQECMDEIALQVLKTFMEKRNIKEELNKLKPIVVINKKEIIRPFYLMKKEEVLIYARIKTLEIGPISGRQKSRGFLSEIKLEDKNQKDKNKKTDQILKKIDLWISDLEKKHPEIKNAIVNSLLRIERL